jgi:hypothetical protein
VATQLETSGPELQIEAWCAVEAEVSLKRRLHLSREGHVFRGTTALVLKPLAPGVETAAD